MKIVVDPFDKKSIAEAEKLVRQYKTDFEAKEREFCERLAGIGVSLAGSFYAMSDVGDEHQYSVYLQEISGGYAVVAEGETIGFLEFGTGIKNPEWDKSGARGQAISYTPPPHGSYGKGHGKQPYGWWFKSEEYGITMHTYGNPPAEAMLSARNIMVGRIAQIAREVWK